jgi:hypothetical protein
MVLLKNSFLLILFFICISIFVVGCGAAAPEPVTVVETVEVVTKEETTIVTLKPEQETETNIISTEVIPLDNCGGNSKVGVDIERSREFIYVVTDKDGYEFGAENYYDHF